MSEPKKMASVIVASMRPKSEGGIHQDPDMKMEDPAEDKEDGSDGMSAVAEEIMDAVHARDAEALVEALKSFFDMCKNMPEEDEEADKMSEGGEVKMPKLGGASERPMSLPKMGNIMHD